MSAFFALQYARTPNLMTTGPTLDGVSNEGLPSMNKTTVPDYFQRINLYYVCAATRSRTLPSESAKQKESLIPAFGQELFPLASIA